MMTFQCTADTHTALSRAHALYFLHCVAPTKPVDAAWTYGTERRHENEFRPLIETYVEELCATRQGGARSSAGAARS